MCEIGSSAEFIFILGRVGLELWVTYAVYRNRIGSDQEN